jgi:hypothetical protein
MAIKDIFLPLVGEPDAATVAAIDKCVALASDLGARVSAVAVEEDIRDFIRLNDATKTARELYDRMLELYPERVACRCLLSG